MGMLSIIFAEENLFSLEIDELPPQVADVSFSAWGLGFESSLFPLGV